MTDFVCHKCGCVECLELVLTADTVQPGAPMLCSACLPIGVVQYGFKAGTGEWHGMFPRRGFNSANDLVVNKPTGFSIL